MKDPHKVILYPLATEKAVRLIEKENKLTFVVSEDANKIDVKRAVEVLYGVEVESVRIVRDPKGRKKAYVKLTPRFIADEVASKLGVI
ncbi:MAG: 50S ribosomal protein L23 [Hadesarchaea archaeon]|nr:MAG: 50S ribosomal protein L23 [Hadesarchaea archaeon]